jgi:probable addiction module antidote protein
MAEYRNFKDILIEELKDPAEARAHLLLALEEYEEDGDTQAFMHMLRYIAEAQGGIGNLATQTKLNRQNLYKIFTGKTTPKFDTALSIIKGLGFRLSIEPVDHVNHQ